MKSSSSAALGAVVFAAGGLSGASAAENEDSAARSSVVVDLILVTAQERERNVAEAPLSIDVIEGDRLDAPRAAGEDILFLAARSPGLDAESSSGRTFPRFYIRGLGNTDFDLNANQPVSLVYDDIVLENSILKGFPAFDLDRIEILQGPRGTLFGRKTPAGVIKFESAKPIGEFEGYGRVSYGRYDTVDAEAAVSGPIIGDDCRAGRGDVAQPFQSGRRDFVGRPGRDLERLLDLCRPVHRQRAWSADRRPELAGKPGAHRVDRIAATARAS